VTKSKSILSRLTGRSKTGASDPGFPEISGQPYLDTLEAIVTGMSADWYLEIGSRTGTSLTRIPCNFIAIDPVFQLENARFRDARQMHFFQMTSDDFFATDFLQRNGIRPKAAFIDGMHHFEYALRDFANCEAVMDKDGVVLLHDVCPTTYGMASRDTTELEASRAWTGDVWKVVVALKDVRPDLEVHVLDCFKTGLCAVRGLDPSNRTLFDEFDEIVARYIDLDLSQFGAEAYYATVGVESAETFTERMLSGARTT
jgi:hypothetical protein